MTTIEADNVIKWMPCPQIDTEYPGLAYICHLDELIVAKQKDALHETIGNSGVSYTIFNKEGQKVFLAVHKKDCRKFELKIFNIYGNEVVQVKKPKYCLTRTSVWAPPGNFVGSVTKEKFCSKIYLIKNKSGEVVSKLRPKGFFHVVYDLFTENEHTGMLAPKWKVLDIKGFGISFPVDMDVGYKAVLLGACFMLIS